MSEQDTQLTGMDGKKVNLKHSKALTAKPWYDAGGASQKMEPKGYDAKRDTYEDYDPESYKAVLATFKKTTKKSRISKKNNKNLVEASKGPIYDKFSRTNQTKSARDRFDTAHYLKDLSAFGGLEFNDCCPGAEGADQLPRNGAPKSPRG